MKEGAPTKRNKSFYEFKAPGLDLQKNNKHTQEDYKTCGSGALSLITGIHVKKVEKDCPNTKKGWFTTRAIKFLRDKGYTVVELSKHNVLNTLGCWNITQEHCLIINACVDKVDNSMFVIHKDRIWHNFQESAIEPLFFINNPTQDVLLVFHKKWKRKRRRGRVLGIFDFTSAC